MRISRLSVVSAILLVAASSSACATTARSGDPVLSDVAPCAADAVGDIAPPANVRFDCGTLNVALDHRPGAPRKDRLDIDVAMTHNPTAPRGVLVWLVGGPGTPGVRLAGEIANQFDPKVLRDYRLVLFSARGTGQNALDCPQLQREVGESDIAAPSESAVTNCADSNIGTDRRFYSTADVVADLDELRQALGAEKLTLAGASYGTVLAARYAIVHPERVARLILDSAVPHDGIEPLNIALMQRSAEVLRMACAQTRCGTDPAADLSALVHARHNGVEMLNLLGSRTGGKPDLADLPVMFHEAVLGDPRKLDVALATLRQGPPPDPEDYSAGLHTATECQDMHQPWGGPETPRPARRALMDAALAPVPDDAFFPFDRDTASGNGALKACELWPETPTSRFVTGRDLPPAPTLLLAGDHDLDTPLDWARQEASRAPNGRLVVIPGAGHVTQDLSNPPLARRVVAEFLLDDGAGAR